MIKFNELKQCDRVKVLNEDIWQAGIIEQANTDARNLSGGLRYVTKEQVKQIQNRFVVIKIAVKAAAKPRK